MSEQPERLDIQVRRARSRRHARSIGTVVGLAGAAWLLIAQPLARGWSWWFVPAAVAMFAMSLWIARLDADAFEELTRWFWRPPR
jgi:fatty acid desaturase